MVSLKEVAAVLIAILVVIILVFVRPPNTKVATTVSVTAATTIAPKNISSSSTITTTVHYYPPCSNFQLFTANISNTLEETCYSGGGTVGVWVSGGITGREAVKIIGQTTNTVYVNQTSSYPCTTFFTNISLPAQYYNVYLETGSVLGNSSLVESNCYYAEVKMNTTLTPPAQVYEQIFNGGFSNGQYTGWNTTGVGWGSAPLNITYADSPGVSCYLSAPWANYNGTYFATTFNCGLSTATGNITSSLFYAREPFLDFQIISPGEQSDYVEVLYNNTPYVTAYYNTYNISVSANSASYFQNASIPLTNVAGDPVQVRVSAGTLTRQRFIAVGNFRISQIPVASVQPVNITFH